MRKTIAAQCGSLECATAISYYVRGGFARISDQLCIAMAIADLAKNKSQNVVEKYRQNVAKYKKML